MAVMTAEARKLTPHERLKLREQEERREYIAKLVLLAVLCAIMVVLFAIGYRQTQEHQMTCQDNSFINYAAAGRSSLTTFGLCE